MSGTLTLADGSTESKADSESGAQIYTLVASAAKTAGANGDGVYIGPRRRLVVQLTESAAATDAGDTLDVFVDFSLDGSNWYNGGHFTQRAGNAVGATREIAVFDAANPGADVIVVTSDAAAAAVRSSVIGPWVRARWAIANAATLGNSSHTIEVLAYAQ